jgi:CheY-like chemotaxis protein
MPPSPPPRPSATAPTCKILLVDDDASILRAIPRLLAPDFEVVPAQSAREALLLLARGEVFDGAIVDLQMPGIDGRQTIDLLLNVAPLLGQRAIILTSGATDPALQRWADELDGARIVRKPPDRELLVETLHRRIEMFPEKPLVPIRSTMRPKKR